MKFNLKNSACAFLTLFVAFGCGSAWAKNKEINKKIEIIEEKAKETAETVQEKSQEIVDNAKESINDAEKDTATIQ